MLALYTAPDRVVRWSLLHRIVRKPNRICYTIFSRLYRVGHFNYIWSSVVVEL